MNAVVRAKFVVSQIAHYETAGVASVVLEPRYDSSLPEDVRFAQATPTGKLQMDVTNPGALEHLKPGSIFYLDFVPAPEGTTPYHQ